MMEHLSKNAEQAKLVVLSFTPAEKLITVYA